MNFEPCKAQFYALETHSELLMHQMEHLYHGVLTQNLGADLAAENVRDFQNTTQTEAFRTFLLRHESSSKNAGCFRIVPASSGFQALPCEQKLARIGHEFLVQNTLYSRHLLAEVSAFAVAQEFQSKLDEQAQYNVPLMLYLTALAALYKGRYKYSCMLLNLELLNLFSEHGACILQRSSEIQVEGTQVLIMLDVRDSVDALQGDDCEIFERMSHDLEKRSRCPEYHRVPELGRFSLAS